MTFWIVEKRIWFLSYHATLCKNKCSASWVMNRNLGVRRKLQEEAVLLLLTKLYLGR